MQLTENQFIILLQTTLESLKIADRCGVFSFSEDTRRNVVELIINKQTEPVLIKSA